MAMSTGLSSLCIIAFMGFLLPQTEEARLTKPPTSESALLYTSAIFSCAGAGNSLVWTVAHTTLNDTEKQERNVNITTSNTSGNFSSNLTIAAVPINDGIEIGCVVFSVNPIMAVAQEAKLTVEGVSPVENIKWHSESDLLSWSPPFFYSKESSDAFVYVVQLDGSDIFNTTSTNVYLNVSSCAEFNVSITVHTNQYVSKENSKTSYNYGNHTVEVTNHTVILDTSRNIVNVSLFNLVKFSDKLCNDTKYIKGSALHVRDKKLMIYPPLKIISNSGDDILVKYNVTQLELYGMYTIQIYLTNNFNINEDQDSIAISTYNVQDLDIRANGNGSVIVTCIFIQGSITESCHLIFIDDAKNLKESFNVTGSQQITLNKNGNYTVEAYDIANNSIIGPAIEYSRTIEVIAVLLSPSFSTNFSSKGTNHMLSSTTSTPSIMPTSSTRSNFFETVLTSVTAALIICIIATCIVMVITRKMLRNSKKRKATEPGYTELSDDDASN